MNIKQSVSLFVFVGGALAAGMAFAQSETEGEAQEKAESVVREPAVGETFVAGSFSQWDLRCERLQSGADRCQMYQLLTDGSGNSVAEINIFPLPSGGPAEAGAAIMTPLETLLTENLRVSVDGGEARVYPYSFCTVEGCVAQLGFTPEEVTGFKRGAAAQVTLVPARAPDRTVDLNMSLSGFTAAYEELRSRAGL